MDKTEKQKKRQQRINFLLTFFDDKPEFQVKEVNGFILTKYWAGNYWGVAIYTKDSWERVKKFNDNKLF